MGSDEIRNEEDIKKMTKLTKGLIKWGASVTAICVLYALLGDIGLLFAVGLSFVFITSW